MIAHRQTRPALDLAAARLLADVSPEPFRCTIAPTRAAPYVQPCGELDLATAAELERCLAELAAAGFDEIVIDLRGVSFMDCHALHVLLRWGARDDVATRVVEGPAVVRRLLEVTGARLRIEPAPAR